MGKSVLGGAWLSGLLALGCALPACVLPGCARPSDGRLLYLRGAIPRPLAVAPRAGVYALYATDSADPKYSVHLAKGDKYGFRVREDDATVAVANDQEIELGDRYVPGYYWIAKREGVGK